MKKTFLSYIPILSSLLLLSSCLEDKNIQKCENIEIKEAFSRATPGPNGAVFMEISNKGSGPISLVGVDPSSFKNADKIELHDHIEENGIMKMRAVDNIPISSHSSVQLKPGGKHIMFFGLKEPLGKGSKQAMTLLFNDVPVNREFSCPITFEVLDAGSISFSK